MFKKNHKIGQLGATQLMTIWSYNILLSGPFILMLLLLLLLFLLKIEVCVLVDLFTQT